MALLPCQIVLGSRRNFVTCGRIRVANGDMARDFCTTAQTDTIHGPGVRPTADNPARPVLRIVL